MDILTCYAVGAQEQGSWAFVHCVGALLSLIFGVACVTCTFTTKGHLRSVSSKQGLCIHVDYDKYHAMDGCCHFWDDFESII